MRTLRSVFAATLIAALCPAAQGQSPHRQLFLVDPYETNGYFLVDQEKFDALGLDHIEVHISAAQLEGRDITTSRVLESITISNFFYGKADLSKILDISANERVYYEAIGYNAAGDIVIDVQSLPTGWYEWPEACRQTCDARWYSWTLVAYDDPLSNHNVIEIQPGSINGLVPRVYIRPGINPNTGVDYWNEFQQQFDPGIHFGMGPETWSEAEFQNTGDIIWVNPVPPLARDFQGYVLGDVTGPVRAVRKDKGPWVGLYAWTEPFDDPYICQSGPAALLNRYNADQNVISALANGGPTGNMAPLSCESYIIAGQQLGWGSAYNCVNINWSPIPGVPFDVPNAANVAVGCITFTDVSGAGPSHPFWPYIRPGIAGVMINEWTAFRKSSILAIPFPSNDTKLAAMPRTVLEEGLYEYVIILEDGRLISIFQEVLEPLTLAADFLNFTNISIYPVPVNEKHFAVDLDINAPMSIELTVVNNSGVEHYAKTMEFKVAGRNKHVVKMNEPWPNGLYHAHFQFPNGSTQSRSFIVDMD